MRLVIYIIWSASGMRRLKRIKEVAVFLDSILSLCDVIQDIKTGYCIMTVGSRAKDENLISFQFIKQVYCNYHLRYL